MTHVLIRHRVRDFEAWKGVFENLADVRKNAGETAFQIYSHQKDPQNLYLLFEWNTVENAQEFFGSARLKEAMAEAGVAEAPEIQFLNEAIRGEL